MKNDIYPYNASRVAFLLLAAGTAGLLLAGHIVIYGQSRGDGTTFDILTTYVSRYAAKAADGWWIKSGILSFAATLALLGVFGMKMLKPRYWKAFTYLASTVLMCVGLVLVASCNLMDPNTTPKAVVINQHHYAGFGMLLGGFIANVGISLSAWKKADPLDLLVLVLGLIMIVWLFAFRDELPGLPQRFVLALIWLWSLRLAFLVGCGNYPPGKKEIFMVSTIIAGLTLLGWLNRPKSIPPSQAASLTEMTQNILGAVRGTSGDIRWIKQEFTPQGQKCWNWLISKEFFINKKEPAYLIESDDHSLLYIRYTYASVEPQPGMEHVVIRAVQDNGKLKIDDIFLGKMKDHTYNCYLSEVVEGQRKSPQETFPKNPPPQIPEKIQAVYTGS